MSRPQNPSAGPGRDPDAPLRRDAALARVRRTRRWVVGTSAALTAGFAVLVAESAPGSFGVRRRLAELERPARVDHVVVLGIESTSTSASSSATSSGDQGLSTPAQAPSSRDSSSSGGDAAVSGGS